MKTTKKKTHRRSSDYKDRLLNENTPFAATEAFKTLRTNLMYTSDDKHPVYGVVSNFPNTGKSLISANTGIAFSMMNKRVLLIDADMRKPVQHKCFSMENETGLSELLSGQAEIKDAIRPVPGYEGLFLITSGHIPPNPQELLSSEKMKQIVKECKELFDVIVLDLPPVGVVSDAMAINEVLTGYVFIVHAGESDKPSLQSTLETMKEMNCNVLGVVLNFVDLKASSYTKSHYYYYNDYKES